MDARMQSLDSGQVPIATHYCAVCRARLIITSSAADHDKAGGLFDASRIDESFIVLDSKRTLGGPGPPRGLDESFVLLPTGTRQQQQQQQHITGAGSGRLTAGSLPPIPQPNQPSQPANASQQAEGSGAPGLDSKLQALSQLFELAAANIQVDQPLCLDCASQLKDEIEAQVQEAEQEIASYADAIQALQAQQPEAALPEEQFQAQLASLQAAQEEQKSAAAQAEQELAAARQELAALQATAADLNALEEKYWHEYNEFQGVLKAHVEERDALQARIAAAHQRKILLQATNVYNDAFKIGHDGPFATISGFRLGRTEQDVMWDEVNAAWGQAVLLLYTMAQNCGITFSAARLIPMGSHPRVADKRGTYDLFGPVSKLWSANYDRAMVCYLACLKEFGEFAAEMDKKLPGERTFEGFPFAIEGDKVNGHTIKLTLNKDAKWTKALKFMLANLKKALQWMVKYETVRQEAAASSRLLALRPEPALS